MVKTAVIGTGYLGKYHVEKFAALPQSQLMTICDINKAYLTELSEKFRVSATTDYRTLLGQVDAVSIATPTPLHFQIARFFLKHGVHVLIEKPITTTTGEANKLIRLAKKNKLILQVGHLERFNSALKSVSPLLQQPRFIEAQRLAPFKLRGSDVSVILDLMIHDIDIALSLAKSSIREIRATGASVLTPLIDIANARLAFKNGCIASITASRINMGSERRLRIFQHDCYLHLDLQRNICHIRKKGSQEMYPGVPAIEAQEIQLEKGDALQEEIAAFLQAIVHNTSPAVSGEEARDALAVAMQITKIVSKNNVKYRGIGAYDNDTQKNLYQCRRSIR